MAILLPQDFFLVEKEKTNTSAIPPKIKQVIDTSIIHLNISHFILPIDLMLINKDILENKIKLIRKFLHDV